MRDVDDLILKCIEKEFKSVKQISDEINVYYVRVSVRLRQLRKRDMVIFIQSNEQHVKGVKPLKYRAKVISWNYI